MKNIFLTGNIQVGKSTILNSFLTNYSGAIGGFQTKPHFTSENERVYVLKSMNSFSKIKEDDKLICFPSGKGGRLLAITDTFEQLGVKILQECLIYEPNLIIMDELGVFETEALNFQEMVHKCLSSSIPVLGVIKNKANPFLDGLRSRKDIIIINVTKENRETQREVFFQYCNNILAKK
jgi:nucleoside-triphosphatase